jgi:hypothetical protein
MLNTQLLKTIVSLTNPLTSVSSVAIATMVGSIGYYRVADQSLLQHLLHLVVGDTALYSQWYLLINVVMD